jgi:hypothetical protein
VRKDEPVKEEVFLKKYAEQVKLYKNTIDVLFSDNSCLNPYRC